MKTTSYLIAAAISAPVAIVLGAPVALVAGVAITSGLAAIAIGDYHRDLVTYDRPAAARTTERHPLAA
ncbi:hypothetical protein [Actomonas aquatica]|uniref:Uncharacterized protein n=1 Tax=Actomonas aquatica TaxID=2866162 RepID=A0ABZ1CEM6_9BACT|nr:hypothetical protein [Opitutus sp. WL0086]WRQ89867.1 hypothetical protein K1X11_010660 [Opitutus sp. WL0086]